MKALMPALALGLAMLALPTVAQARGAVVTGTVVAPMIQPQGVVVGRPSGFFTTPIGPSTTFSNTVVTPLNTIVVTPLGFATTVMPQRVFVQPHGVFVQRGVFVQPRTVFTVPLGSVFTGSMVVPQPGAVFVTQ